MKNKKILLVLIVFFVLPWADAALIAQIDVKDFFYFQERMYFQYTLVSDTDTQIVLLPHINCSDAPVSFLSTKTINLTANVPYNDTYTDMVVGDFEPQSCTASLQIISPTQQKFEKIFLILTNPGFSFSVFACQDYACSERASIFIKGDDIYLNYLSAVENSTINSSLAYPDGKVVQLILPTTIKAEQIGTYLLEITASKKGYKPAVLDYQFGVIEEEPVIEPLFKKSTLLYWLIPLFSVVLLIIIGAFIFFRKKKQPPQQPSQPYYPGQYQQQRYYK